MKKSLLLIIIILYMVLLKPITTFSQDSWSQGSDLLKARQAHVVCAVNGKVYVVGGTTQYGATNTVEEYNTLDEAIEKLR